ncbi:recombinase family protein [Sphingomonas arantia]|uniref:Recombinase family protein n=1 Tax=Sphingomonas arantia TaxID=1460676 RepID=A0ABW4TYD2_9SPHN
MSVFAYARSGSAHVDLSVQITSLKEAGCADIEIDRGHSRHPRDLRRRAALLECLKPGDTVAVYELECLAVHGADLVATIAHIRSRSADVRTTGLPGVNNLCGATLDAIASAGAAYANRGSERKNVPPCRPGRYTILGPADWPQVQKDCAAMSMTAAAKRHAVSRTTFYNYIRRMRGLTDGGAADRSD